MDKFSIKDLFRKCMRPNPQFPADLVTFTEESLYLKPHFLCSGTDFSEPVDNYSDLKLTSHGILH